MKFRFLTVLLCFLLIITNIQAYSMLYDNGYLKNKISDQINDSSINTVQIYLKGWFLSYPIMRLNNNEILELHFDDLSDEINDFYYEIKLCNANWEISDVNSFEYIEGVEINRIDNYERSFNTFTPYIHYTLDIPNNDISIILPGNYVVIVYDSYEKEHIVFQKRFFVYNDIVSVVANASQAKFSEFRSTSQEVDFEIQLGDYYVSNPYEEIKVVIMQNGRFDNAITDLKPLFIKDKLLIYNYDRENVFPGGSEFRHFDLKSIRYKSDRVARIDFIKQQNHITLFVDEKRTFKQYFNDKDINGKYTVEIQEADNWNIDADYVWVHFTLLADQPYFSEDLFVFGAFTNWEIQNQNSMKYNFNEKSYNCSMFLKQGYYNYQYIINDSIEKTMDSFYVEGNHYETENDYLILVYYHDVFTKIDKLIGYRLVNSVTK